MAAVSVMVGLMLMLRKQMNEREERERSGRLGDIEERVTTPWWATVLLYVFKT